MQKCWANHTSNFKKKNFKKIQKKKTFKKTLFKKALTLSRVVVALELVTGAGVGGGVGAGVRTNGVGGG